MARTIGQDGLLADGGHVVEKASVDLLMVFALRGTVLDRARFCMEPAAILLMRAVARVEASAAATRAMAA